MMRKMGENAQKVKYAFEAQGGGTDAIKNMGIRFIGTKGLDAVIYNIPATVNVPTVKMWVVYDVGNGTATLNFRKLESIYAPETALKIINDIPILELFATFQRETGVGLT